MLIRWSRIVAVAICCVAPGCAQADEASSPNLFEAFGKFLKSLPDGQTATPAAGPSAPDAAGVVRGQPPPGGPPQRRRVALVIGNAAYRQGELVNPVKDARAMATRLGALGFEVLLYENLKIRDIGRVYREFRYRITPGSVALVFYAGHGVQFKGQNYFPAVDSEIAMEEDVPLQSLHLATLLDNMEEAKAGISLVFLDACRDNPFARHFRSGSRGLAKVESASGTLIHYATRPGSVAADGEGENGTYTEALLAQIDEPGVPVEQVLKRVTNRVMARTDGQQEPWVEGSLRGEFYFVAQAPASAPGQSAGDPEAEVWQAAETADTVSAYQTYLGTYPTGRYAVAAHIRIEALQRQRGDTAGRGESAPVRASVEDAETAVWNEVKASGEREYLDAYLRQYPKGRYAALAKQELKKIADREAAERAREESARLAAAERGRQEAVHAEQAVWQAAKRADSDGAYAHYLGLYPQGRYANLARAAQARLQRQAARTAREKEEAEQRAWNAASGSDSVVAYDAFLEKHPAGRYAEAARAARQDLRQRDEAATRQRLMALIAAAPRPATPTPIQETPSGMPILYRSTVDAVKGSLSAAQATRLPAAYRGDAEAGDPVAQFSLANAISGLEGGEAQDKAQEAFQWYRRAAEQGLAAAQSNLGVMYADGRGVAKNEGEAAKWYRKAAEHGDVAGQYNLAEMYRLGRGVEKDEAEATTWYRRAAEQGDAAAQYSLGDMYRLGRGMPKDEAEAVKWYRLAAAQGLAAGQYELGASCERGYGTSRDEAEAVKWYRLAAAQGYGPAQNGLGNMYAAGRGVARDEAEAAVWYRKAADQGNAAAQQNLGDMYRYGRGVAQDDAAAALWYRKAAQQSLERVFTVLKAMLR